VNEPPDTVISMGGLVGVDVVVVALGIVVVGVDVVGDLLGPADGLEVVGLVVVGIDVVVGDLLGLADGLAVGVDVVGDLLGLADGLEVANGSLGVGADVRLESQIDLLYVLLCSSKEAQLFTGKNPIIFQVGLTEVSLPLQT